MTGSRDGQGPTTLDLRQRTRGGQNTSHPRRCCTALATAHEWADTESVDEETDVNSADLQGFVRNKLEALSAEIDDFPVSCRVSLPTRSLRNWRNISFPAALMTVRAARIKMKGKSEGKGEPSVSFSVKGNRKWRKPSSGKHLQDKLAARKAKSICHECGQRGHWAGDPGCSGTRDTNFTTWSDEQMLPDREDYKAIMMVARCFSSFSGLREHSVCTTSVTNLQQFPVGEHAPVTANDRFNHVPVVIGTVPPAFTAEFGEIVRSVMESTDSCESKSDLRVGIIDTACLFCVAGSDWWVNLNLVADVGLRHEIDETREGYG